MATAPQILTPARGRGRGRPRLYARGSSSALTRRRTPSSTPKSVDGTPTTARRRTSFGMGYRPGGAGGGGRYIHPVTGEEIPASVYRSMVKRGEMPPGLDTPVPNSSARRSAPMPQSTPLPPPPPPSVGPDGVYKPREERSYTEFHADFKVEQLLHIYSAEEVDGENYRPPNLDHGKSVKIIDVKDEDERRRAESAGRATSTIPDNISSRDRSASVMSAGMPHTFPTSPSVNGIVNTPHMDTTDTLSVNMKGAGVSSGYPVHMEGVQSATTPNDLTVDPALAALTPPPPPSIDFPPLHPMDPSLGHDFMPAAQAQTQTPAATPTDVPMTDDTIHLASAPAGPSTPIGDSGSFKRVSDTPTLAALRPHRLNAGKPPPRQPPPSTARRQKPQAQGLFGDEKLHLRAPSFRLIRPYQYSEFAWNHDIGTTGLYGINNPTATKGSFSDVMIAAGYQRSPKFERPDTFFRDYPDSSVDEELGTANLGLVEYDMDEQDEKWLTTYNSHRSPPKEEPISRESFELAMTKIEKEWVALERRIPKVQAKPHGNPYSRRRSTGRPGEEDDDEGAEDSKCAICDDGECENANAIVFCDGCNLAVHQECYGVPYIPEGQWHCRKCQEIPRQTATCVFCPNVDGAFKKTTQNRWSHLLCAIWIPEVRLANPAFMEPVEGVELVPKSRWKLSCYICKQKMGACIQCSNKNCFIAFHVTCGRRARLHMKMKNTSGPGAQLESSGLKAYCDRHVPADWRRENDVSASQYLRRGKVLAQNRVDRHLFCARTFPHSKLQVERATADAMDYYSRELYGREWGDSQASAITGPGILPDNDYGNGIVQRITLKTGDKRKRATEPKMVWKLPSGAPIIPHVLYTKISDYMEGFGIKDAKAFTAEVCKYWTLKREARRGACLIRRLQIQADSSSFTSLEVTRKNYPSLGKTIGGKKLERRKEFASTLENDLARIMEIMSSHWKNKEAWIGEADMLKAYVDAVYFPELPVMREVLAQAEKLDYDHDFQFGFVLIRDRIEHRLYPSVSTLATDIRSVLRSPPKDPKLDFDIRVQGYNSPPVIISQQRSTKKDPAAIATIGRRIAVSLEDVFKQAAMIEKDLLKRMQERPAKRVRVLEEIEQVNGTTPKHSSNMNGASPMKICSPSAQLEQESSPQRPKLIPTISGNGSSLISDNQAVLGALTATVKDSMGHGKWDKSWPRWFANDYRSGAQRVDSVSDADHRETVNGRSFDSSKLAAELIDESALQSNSTSSTNTPSPERTATPEISVNAPDPMDIDEDMEDAPGEIDEDFVPFPVTTSAVTVTDRAVAPSAPLPGPPPAAAPQYQIIAEQIPETKIMSPPVPAPAKAKSPSRSPKKVQKLPNRSPSKPIRTISPSKSPRTKLVPSPKDNQAVPLPPLPLLSLPMQTDLHDEDAEGEDDDDISPSYPPPPQQVLHRLIKPPTIVTSQPPRNKPAYHEDIRNDDHLMGGYRAEDLPSPVGETTPSPRHRAMSSGAAAAIMKVAMASFSSREPDLLDLPVRSQQMANPLGVDKNDLENMTNTSVLSDYPDDIDEKAEYDLTPVKKHGEEDEEDDDGTTPSPGKRKRNSQVFTRDSNGRFGRNKSSGPSTPSSSSARSRRKKRI